MSDQDRRRYDGPPDGEIIARVLQGDVEQFARLVARYQRALYRHAVSMVLDHDVAADMVQDAFIRAYRALPQCRDRSRFRAWLFQTLRRRCLDYLKEPRRQTLRLDDAGDVGDDSDRGYAGDRDRHALRLDLARALAGLPVEQREVFVMHYVDGVPHDAIAELLQLSVSAVKMRAMRARQALQAALGDRVTHEPSPSSVYQAR